MPFEESDFDRASLMRSAGTRVSVAGVLIWAIFDEEFVEVLDGLMGSSTPMIQGLTKELGDAGRDTVIEVHGKSFSVVGAPQHDGTGLTRLMLQAIE